MVGKEISHYIILEKLGEGGMGVVYKAEDAKLKRTVALKFLPPELTRDPEAKQRFIHEAQAASALEHHNICNIHEIEETEDGQVFICMAYYEGESLKKKIECGPLKLEVAVEIATQMARGLDKAHKQGIVHRDVKPANVMTTEDGVAKIVDFGLAKLAGRTKVTKTGTTLGTAAYMSPEQARGEEVDHRTDIWSLGVVLYEMVTGQLPFQGEYEQAVVYSILNVELEPMTGLRTGVPMELERIVSKALAKEPAERYQHVDEMLVDLSSITKDLKSRPVTIKEMPTRPGLQKIRSPFVYGIVAALVILFLAVGYYFFTAGPSETIDSIAVLPLENLSGDSEQEYFVDGMTEALITELSRIGALKVISRTSVMQYKNVKKALPEIARSLNVDAVVEGSALLIGDRVRITAQLIEAASDRHLWAESYDRDLTDILMLQREVARAIARQIEVKLTPQEETLLARTREVNPETYEAYLRGMFYLNKFTPEGIEKGLAYLHEAVEKDPADPLAYAGLALGYNLIAHTPSPPPYALPRARTAALRALELDENLAEVHLALAMIKTYADWDRTGAEQAYQRALELNPNLALARAHYGWYLEIDGHVDEALAELNQAQKLDPLAPIYPAWQGWMYFWEGEYDAAIEEAQKSLELNPDFPIGLYVLGCGYAAKGRYEEAITTHQKAGSVSPDFRWGLGQTYALAGRREEALEVAAELESQGKVWDTFGLAEIYAALGEKDEAFRWLEAAYQQRHPYIQWLRRDGSFDSLRDDPRFHDLAQRLNLPPEE